MNLIEQLKLHEGFRSDFYLCSAGKKTIGYGRNVENNPFSQEELNHLGRSEFLLEPMTEDEAEYLLVNDVKAVEIKLQTLPFWNDLSSARKAVCLNMAFNLGVAGFFQFKNMISALSGAFYERAAREMLDSKWATQVKQRAECLSAQMLTGEWQ